MSRCIRKYEVYITIKRTDCEEDLLIKVEAVSKAEAREFALVELKNNGEDFTKVTCIDVQEESLSR